MIDQDCPSGPLMRWKISVRSIHMPGEFLLPLSPPWHSFSSHHGRTGRDERGPQWRAFTVPWTYTAVDDLFLRPIAPPSPDTLSWEPVLYVKYDGTESEYETPCRYPLEDMAAIELPKLNQQLWDKMELARSGGLFPTVIEHFFVKGFLDGGIDEFLAHISALEAAVGLETDYKQRRGTAGTATRIAKLLKDAAVENQFRSLFKLRSQYLHGRQLEKPISGVERRLARSLARRTISAVATAAASTTQSQSRESFLRSL